MDSLPDWFSAVFVVDPTAQILSSTAYQAYTAWAHGEGRYVISHKAMVMQLRAIPGVLLVRSAGRRYLRGIALRPQTPI